MYARPGDTAHISEMFASYAGPGTRSTPSTSPSRATRSGTHGGASSTRDLTARHPRTGELLSTVTFVGRTPASAGGPRREPTYDGLRADEAKGSEGGHRPVVAADESVAVRTAYLQPLDRRPRP